MSAAATSRPLSLEEWAALDQPGELVDGLLVEEEMPTFVHEAVVVWLVWTLRTWAEGRGLRIGASGAKFGVAPGRGRMGDVSVYLAGDRKPPARGIVRVPPSIMIEVVSDSARDQRRDRVEKLREYAAFGVTYYWLVDPEARTFQIHELGGDGAYVHRVDVIDGRIADVPGCPELVIDVDALWREVDQVIAEG